MRRHIVILALASLCAAASPSRAEQASSAKEHREKASNATSHRARASARASTVASRRPRLATTTTANRRLRVKTASRRPRMAEPAPVTADPRGRKKPRLLDARAAMRQLLFRPTAAPTTTALITEDLPWIREEWDTRPVAATDSGIVPALSTDDWRLLMAAGLSGFALVSPITPAMGFPGLRTHQRPPAGLVCLTEDGLDMCLPAVSAVKDPYYDNRWAGISVRVFEGRF
jgi:hypothetical protein